jgi:CubicO group peptidase (beta-lactamase class C family)
MRRALLTAMVAVSLVSLTRVTPGVILHAADDLVLTRFGEYLDSVRSQAGVPALAATIVGPADVQWERAFGQSNVESALATLPNTPFHLDGLTQLFTASMVLRCVEEGRLSLDDRIGTYAPAFGEPDATLRQLLSHTSGTPDNLAFTYRPSRLDIVAAALSSCTGGESYRASLGETLEQRLIMFDSVPGPDVLQLAPGNPFPATTIDRYRGVLGRLASPYSVDLQGRPSPSRYAASTLTPSTGLISTVRDMAKFDLALKRGFMLRADTLARAWTAPVGRLGQPLPHGLGWFVQSYAGEPVVWQFGVGDNASSSMVITLPRRGLTLILLANSDGLVKRFPLAAGDLTVSPFGRLFLGVFVR